MIGDSYRNDAGKYRPYFDPSLIFKIRLNGNVIDDSFRKELERAGIKTISSAPDKLNYWVAFTDDVDFKEFRKKLETRATKDKATFVDMIEGIEDIPLDEKLGESLKNRPLVIGTPEYLDVEIWRMEDSILDRFQLGLYKMVRENHGEVTDMMKTDNFCVLRILCDAKIFHKLAEMREVSHIDRPPEVNVMKKLESDIKNISVKGTLDPTKPGILIVDSGVRNHPLLKDAIADRNVFPSSDGRVREGMVEDDVGHGTAVAGIALYGDVKRCVEVNDFDPAAWLYSARVMYRGDDGSAIFHKKSLLENQLQDAIEWVIKNYSRCRIINISLGNSEKRMTDGQGQFRIAVLIDEFSVQYPDLLFTIAAGNMDIVDDLEPYPHNLTSNAAEVKIIDPATSVHGITVGSVYSRTTTEPAGMDLPSPFTCTGPGLRGMVKPEVVDYGGGYGQDLVTLNPEWISEGRLFTLERGTSFSAPKIAYILARLRDAFPDASRNLLKALLLSSAIIPPERPGPLNEISLDGKNGDLQKILNVYGYGKPDLNRALHSEPNRVLLIHDGKIGLNRVEIFEINLPKEFLLEGGRRTIDVTLVFDPPINGNRADYLGVVMEYHLFKNLSTSDVKNAYGKIGIDWQDGDVVPDAFRNGEIKMHPRINIRKKGAHQKSTISYIRKPRIISDKPLILVVVCQKKWFGDNGSDFRQPYSVIVTFKHEQEIDLYNMIKFKNKARARVR